MEYTGWVTPGGYDQVVFRGDPTVGPAPDVAAPEFLAFWVRDGAVLAGMNANVWDVTETIGALVKAGLAGAHRGPGRAGRPGGAADGPAGLSPIPRSAAIGQRVGSGTAAATGSLSGTVTGRPHRWLFGQPR